MFCKKCGKELEDDALFCPGCGTKTDKKAEEAADPPKKKTPFILAGILTAILIAGCGGIFLFLNKGEDKPAEKPERQEKQIETARKEEGTSEDEYIFPHSDKEYLTDAEVENLTEEELGYARNEIIARHGRIYTDDTYKPYFESKSWYEGTVEPEAFDSDYENQLNEIEKANIRLIKKYEERPETDALARQYYAGILREYQEAEAGGFSGGNSQYPHVNPLLMDNSHEASLCYALVDLCNDGIPELLIGYARGGTGSDYEVVDLYGYEGEIAKQLAVVMGFDKRPLGEQNLISGNTHYAVCDNGLLREDRTDGGSDQEVTYYELVENTVELCVKEGAGQDGDIYFEKDEGGLGVMESTKEFYENMREKYALRADLSWYTLKNLEIAVQEESAFREEDAYEPVLKQYADQYDDLSYSFADLDGNGISELLIAEVPDVDPEQYVVYGIYTCVDGAPQSLLRTEGMGETVFYYLCEDGLLLKVETQNDSSWYGNHFYRLEAGTASLVYVDGAWIYPGSSLGIMYDRAEEFESGSGQEMDDESYRQMMNQHPLKTDMEWIRW